MLIWTSSFLPALIFSSLGTISFFLGTISLWGCFSLVKKFMCLHFSILPRSDTIWFCLALSPLLHLEWSPLLSSLWLEGIPVIIWSFLMAESETAMALHSSTLAWKIPWMEEPGKLQSTVSLRVGHDWATSLSLFTFMHWRRKWQPTPVFLPGESQGAWWAAVYGVAQSRTKLKWLSSSSNGWIDHAGMT